jgi:hypothetical protein
LELAAIFTHVLLQKVSTRSITDYVPFSIFTLLCQARFASFPPVGGELKLDEFRGLQHANDSTSFVKTARDRNDGRSRTVIYIPAIGKTFDGEHLQRRVSSSPEGETGQWPPIMSA